MTDKIDTSAPERIWAVHGLTDVLSFNVYDNGGTEYIRADLGSFYQEKDIDALMAERDAAWANAKERRAQVYEMRARAEKAEAEVERLRRAATRAGAGLVAAISLLEDGGRLAAPSDKMFNQMLEDYRRRLEELRAALRQDEGEE